MTEISAFNAQTNDGGVELLIEVEGRVSGLHKAGIGDRLEDVRKYSEVAMNLTSGMIHSAAHHFHQAIMDIDEKVRPHEIEVEFGVKVEVQGTVETSQLTAVIVKGGASGTAGGQFTVKFKWNVERPNRAKILLEGQN